MRIKTGIIAAAGSGTRMLPVTLGYPKELLPIINKPAIQLIVEELIDSGITRIIIITGENPEPIRRQYDPSLRPPRGAYPALDAFADRLSGVDLVFEAQEGPYGNGTPLLVARRHIPEGEGLIYAFGDDIIKSESPFTKQLIETHERTGALALGVQEVAWEEVSRFGIARTLDGSHEIESLIEKPRREEAGSNLAVFGRYLLSHEIIRILVDTPLGKANELWLTDALRSYMRAGGKIIAERVRDGRWLTIGDPVGYLRTTMEYALADPELKRALEVRLRELLK